MILINDHYMPSNELEIPFLENALELDLMCFDLHKELAYYECAFLEDGESEEKKGSKISEKIHKLVEKIRAIIDGIKNAFNSWSKDKLTADVYMNSETAKIALDYDIEQMKKSIDNEFLATRKVVQKLSKWTGGDPEAIARECDAINQHLIDNQRKYIEGAKAIGGNLIHIGVADAWAKHAVENCSKIGKLNQQIEDISKSMLRDTRNPQLGAKIKDQRSTASKAIDTLFAITSKLTTQYGYVTNSVINATKKGAATNKARKNGK